MSQNTITDKEFTSLTSKKGLYALLQNDNIDFEKALKFYENEKKMAKLQEELIQLQSWVVANQKKVIIIFEGRDSAGKGGAIRRISENMNPRQYRTVALPKPDETEAGQWYFERYVKQLPNAGEIVFFDRSWYNRAVVEPVNGFCTDEEYDTFMLQVNPFENMLVSSGFILIKVYFSISKEEQAKRFNEILSNPLKKWKYSEVDKRALELWDRYTEYKSRMLEETNTDYAPWQIFQANKKGKARVDALEYILSKIPYKSV